MATTPSLLADLHREALERVFSEEVATADSLQGNSEARETALTPKDSLEQTEVRGKEEKIGV